MKFIILLSLLFPSYCFSQSIQELDNENGYKDLKFDMPIDSVLIKTKAKKSSFQATDETTAYDVEYKKYKKIGKLRAEITIIEFNRDCSLTDFLFTMDNYNRNEYTYLASYFTARYGRPTKEDGINNIYQWKGRKVMIILSYSDKLKRVDFNILNLLEREKYKRGLQK
jgi:hypothetical protein